MFGREKTGRSSYLTGYRLGPAWRGAYIRTFAPRAYVLHRRPFEYRLFSHLSRPHPPPPIKKKTDSSAWIPRKLRLNSNANDDVCVPARAGVCVIGRRYDAVYKKTGWIDYDDWLGVDTKEGVSTDADTGGDGGGDAASTA